MNTISFRITNNTKEVLIIKETYLCKSWYVEIFGTPSNRDALQVNTPAKIII